MLFDLRGRGRRRTVQVIYLSLALLLGGGLVLFGIGGDVQGGLFDAFRENQGNATEQIQQRVDTAREATTARPRDPATWARLAEAEYQLAGQSEGYVQETGQFTGESRTHLVAAQRAWQRHLSLAGDRADPNLAATMRNALSALGDEAAAVRAQEIVLDGLEDPGFGDYAQLAALAYGAGQTRKGDLAADRAKELAPRDQREQLEQSLQQAKAQAAQGATQGGAPAGAATPPVTTGG
jgi:hypothetical protein